MGAIFEISEALENHGEEGVFRSKDPGRNAGVVFLLEKLHG